MAVHRISDRAELALRELCKREGKTASVVLSELVLAYLRGLSFE